MKKEDFKSCYKSKCFKKSIRRKRFDELSRRQKNRIRVEVKQNIKSFIQAVTLSSNLVSVDNNHLENETISFDNYTANNSHEFHQEISSTFERNNICTEGNDLNYLINEGSNESEGDVFINDFLFRNVYTDDLVQDDNSDEDLNFRDKLRNVFLENSITLSQGSAVLKVLRTLPGLNKMPRDCRTLYETPRKTISLTDVNPGKYLHIGFENAILSILRRTSSSYIPSTLEIDVSTDGVAGDKQNRIHYWPIQVKVSNILSSKPEVIGIYRGRGKPSDAVQFFSAFNAEVKLVLNKGGIMYNEQLYTIKFRIFIADAPARAFVLNHKGHNAINPCSRCKVSGESPCSKHPLVYVTLNGAFRTHEEYISRHAEDLHFKAGRSPLEEIFPDLPTQVVFEYMHLVLLGLMKKLLGVYVLGKFNIKFKLSAQHLGIIKNRLSIIESYCPREFSRKPVSIEFFLTFKATEYRLLLIYTGIVAFHGILEFEPYVNFVLFHAIVRCLTVPEISESSLQFAEIAVPEFVSACIRYFGSKFASYNIHVFLHIVEDVRRYGNLDNFSAFPYETNVASFQKWVSRPGNQLVQIHHRLIERQCLNEKTCVEQQVKLLRQHTRGPLPDGWANCIQYFQVEFKKVFLSLEQSDNCCILNDGTIGIVINIISNNDLKFLVLRRFRCTQDFYSVGITSSSIGIYKCSDLSNEIITVELDHVRSKCFKMPYWESSYLDSGDIINYNDRECLDEDEDYIVRSPVPGLYIVAELF